MHKISVFNHVSADGFFAGPHGEIDWFKAIRKDPGYAEYTQRQAQGRSTLVFGRTTYEMMRSYWPTPMAHENDPHMAEVMNTSPKVVFSKTLQGAEEGPTWKNVTILRAIEKAEVEKLKERGDITILGSGSIVQEFTNLGLIDEYCLIVVPIILGAGKSMFTGAKETNLKLLESRAFDNSLVVLRYQASRA